MCAGGESGSDEGSEVSSEGAGLHWVSQLRVLPMYCGRRVMDGGGGRGRGEGEGESDLSLKESSYYDLDHILQELEVGIFVTELDVARLHVRMRVVVRLLRMCVFILHVHVYTLYM